MKTACCSNCKYITEDNQCSKMRFPTTMEYPDSMLCVDFAAKEFNSCSECKWLELDDSNANFCKKYKIAISDLDSICCSEYSPTLVNLLALLYLQQLIDEQDI